MEKIVEILLENGANANALHHGDAPLTILAQKIFPDLFSEELAKKLIEHGANVNSVDKKGDTPLSERFFKF